MSPMTPDETLKRPDTSKPKMPLSRILLLLVLLVAVVLLFLDQRARSSANDANDRLSVLIAPDAEGKKNPERTPDIVTKLVGKEPDENAGYELSSHQVKVYSWRGAFRTYSVHAGFRKGNVLLLEKLNLNDPITDGREASPAGEE